VAEEPQSPPVEPEPDALDVAAAHVLTEVATARPTEEAGAVRAALTEREFEFTGDIAILEGDTLAGLLPMERLLAADAHTAVADLMDADPPVAAPGLDQEQVAWKMVDRAELSVAVVDADGRFVGLIPPYRMLAVVLAEHDQDLARLSGIAASSSIAREAATERLSHRFRHRLPWLAVGLLGAMATAILLGAFEDELAENVLLALFIPAVVYLANAVGQQTATVVIRGFTVGVELKRIAWRETLTGLWLGLGIAVTFLPFVALVWGDFEVAVTVSVAVFASCVMATLVAMALPWAINRLGHDPAFGSGPLATVIQDLFSIAVYVAVALAISP
jgi:magnesium transporter